MKILLVEPYYTGSHKQWAEGLQKFSKNEIVNNGFIPVWLPLLRNFELHDEDTWRLAEIVFKELLSEDR